MCDGAILALTCLTWPGLRAGQSILIYGASGSIGTAGVQLAKRTGADVTAVCNTENIEVVRSLRRRRRHRLHGRGLRNERPDLRRRPRRRRQEVVPAVPRLTKGRGSYVSTGLGPYSQNVPLMLWTRFVGSKKAMMPIPRHTKDKVLRIKELIEAGLYRAVIDRSYPLEEAANATRYVETGQKTGNVVLTVRSEE